MKTIFAHFDNDVNHPPSIIFCQRTLAPILSHAFLAITIQSHFSSTIFFALVTHFLV
jgi:hypothetical protein